MKTPVKMRRQLLILVLTLGLAAAASLPEITTYAKVTKNGEETNKTQQGGPFTWLINTFSPANKTMDDEAAEGRSNSGISITVSPVYVPPKIPVLQKGEAVDYPTTKRYSTLDEEMIARLDSQSRRIQAQDRFHPPAIFEHDIAHGNAARLKQSSSSSSSSSTAPASSGSSGPPTGPSQDPSPGPSGGGGSRYSLPIYPGGYDYKPPSFIDAKPPPSFDSYSKPDTMPKQAPSSYDSPSISYDPSPDSYGPPADYPDHGHDHNHDHDHSPPDFDPELSHEVHSSNYGGGPIYGNSVPPKPIEYASHFDHPAFVDDPYIHGHDDHHDIIYDHLPDDHTAPPPEMMDQRLNKKPYSYYFVGKKLWYIPLYFSIYFIFYIAALILKSIARHKINFPAALSAAAQSRSSTAESEGPGWMDLTVRVLEGIETARKAFGKTA